MSRKLILILLFVVACSLHAIAQTDYYYHMGKKIPLTLNENKVCVSIPKDCEMICERVRENVQVLSTIGDDYLDIFVITRSDFETLALQDSWEEDVKSVIITPCYFTEEDVEVFSTPYLNVELKKEEDIDLLTSYAEKYKLRFGTWHSSLLPLWYVMAITPDSEKNSVECANELYESGDFASAVADFAPGANTGPDIEVIETTIPSVTTTTILGTPLEIYDMQGRKLQQAPQKGVYIQNGKKIIK